MRQVLKSSVSILALALAGSVTVYAQSSQDATTPPPHHPGGPGMHRRGPNPEMETKMLTHRLGLSEGQAAAVEPILATEREEMKAMRPAEGTKPDFQAMQGQMKTLHEETKAKLAGILSPEQMEKFDKMHEHGPRGPHGPGEYGHKPPPPPPAA